MGVKKSSPNKKKHPVVVAADPFESQGTGTGFAACSLVVVVLVGFLAIIVAKQTTVGSTEEKEGHSSLYEGYHLPDVFSYLTTIDRIPYHLLVTANFSSADGHGGHTLPPLPENAFKNPYDIIPALDKAISDDNVAVSMQLVQLLLDEEKASPAGATVAAARQVGAGFGQPGLYAKPDTKMTARSASAYARLLWKAAEPFYFVTNPQLLHLRVMLLHKFFDITFDPRTQSNDGEKRRAVNMLGVALEERNEEGNPNRIGDVDAAWRLYHGAIALGLWGLPDQRPQHYFSFLEPGKPFPSVDLYKDAVNLLETNSDTIRKELILHKKFPGKIDIDREHLAGGGGRWLQADFLTHREWDQDNVERFPQTAAVLKKIDEEYGTDLPDGIIQMSTMTKGTKVRPHCGSGNHKVRLHLALHIPTGVGIKIANDTDCWVNGKVLPVDDSYVHSVWNDSDEPRTVLIVDVWKAGMSQEDKDRVIEYFNSRDKRLAAGNAVQGIAIGGV